MLNPAGPPTFVAANLWGPAAEELRGADRQHRTVQAHGEHRAALHAEPVFAVSLVP